MSVIERVSRGMNTSFAERSYTLRAIEQSEQQSPEQREFSQLYDSGSILIPESFLAQGRERLNPFGKISDAEIAVISDTHPYPDFTEESPESEHAKQEPVSHLNGLPGLTRTLRKAFDWITRQEPYLTVQKPRKNNHALSSWPAKWKDELQKTPRRSEHVIGLFLGDICADGEQLYRMIQGDLLNYDMMDQVIAPFNADAEKSIVTTEPGDHGADTRPYNPEDLFAQIEYHYLIKQPEFFLQEFTPEGQDDPTKALLRLDTNLLNPEFVNPIHQRAELALEQARSQRDITSTVVTLTDLYQQDIITMIDILNMLNENARRSIMLDLVIKHYIEEQQYLINHAREKQLQEVIVAGHIAELAIGVAENLQAKNTIVLVGHEHLPYDTANLEKAPFLSRARVYITNKDKRKNDKGNLMRIVCTGATFDGFHALGIPQNPTAYRVHISASTDTEVHAIALGKKFEEAYVTTRELQTPIWEKYVKSSYT